MRAGDRSAAVEHNEAIVVITASFRETGYDPRKGSGQADRQHRRQHMCSEGHLRELLGRVLAWEDAHVGFESTVAGIPEALRSVTPEGLPHSPWQLLEHLRRTQHDILDFCVNPQYAELNWPEDYWSASAPPSDAAWHDSIRGFLEDRAALQRLVADTRVDLAAAIPHGTGQTFAREILLAADHAAYHLGQLILVRRALGIWK
jgi:hypothetical protein